MVLIGGADVTHLTPAERGIAMVFQSYALFPHLSVAENIIFGLRVRGVSRTERDSRLKRVADIVGLAQLPRPQAIATLRWPASARGAGTSDRRRGARLPDG